MFLTEVYAAVDNTKLLDPVSGNFTDLSQVFNFVTNLIIGIGWGLVFVMLALGFIQYVMSRGEKTAVDSAQKWLTYAVIGGAGLFFIGFIRGLIPDLIGGSTIDVEGVTESP